LLKIRSQKVPPPIGPGIKLRGDDVIMIMPWTRMIVVVVVVVL
jgi:hypothetical protein